MSQHLLNPDKIQWIIKRKQRYLYRFVAESRRLMLYTDTEILMTARKWQKLASMIVGKLFSKCILINKEQM